MHKSTFWGVLLVVGLFIFLFGLIASKIPAGEAGTLPGAPPAEDVPTLFDAISGNVSHWFGDLINPFN